MELYYIVLELSYSYMDLQEFKRMNNIVVHSATNGWRALIYKVFEELSDENNEVDLTNSLTSGYKVEEYIIYPKKLFRDSEYRISMLRDVENEYLTTIDEDNEINIVQLSLDELNGFTSFLMDFLQTKEKK